MELVCLFVSLSAGTSAAFEAARGLTHLFHPPHELPSALDLETLPRSGGPAVSRAAKVLTYVQPMPQRIVDCLLHNGHALVGVLPGAGTPDKSVFHCTRSGDPVHSGIPTMSAHGLLVHLWCFWADSSGMRATVRLAKRRGQSRKGESDLGVVGYKEKIVVRPRIREEGRRKQRGWLFPKLGELLQSFGVWVNLSRLELTSLDSRLRLGRQMAGPSRCRLGRDRVSAQCWGVAKKSIGVWERKEVGEGVMREGYLDRFAVTATHQLWLRKMWTAVVYFCLCSRGESWHREETPSHGCRKKKVKSYQGR